MSHARTKELLAPWREALYNLEGDRPLAALETVAPDARFRMCHPFGDFDQAGAFYRTVFVPLIQAWPDLERRDYILLAEKDEDGALWVGCAGFYTGTFLAPWLDIPPTGLQSHLRFHEFYRIEGDRVVELQAIWDIPEVMLQANAWPLAPSLGREWHVPAPATGDGLRISGSEEQAQATRRHVVEMLEHMKRHPDQGPEAMQMERFWHEKFSWYGPAGIGTGRGVAGFRHWHQIPFLRAMPDRGKHNQNTNQHFFTEGAYAAVTGWPNMAQTLSGDGWLGIAPTGKRVTLRSLDFWRLEKGRIRENWVLVDLLDLFQQIGVDVFARLREFNKRRSLNPIDLKKGY